MYFIIVLFVATSKLGWGWGAAGSFCLGAAIYTRSVPGWIVYCIVFLCTKPFQCRAIREESMKVPRSSAWSKVRANSLAQHWNDFIHVCLNWTGAYSTQLCGGFLYKQWCGLCI